jgi:phosphoglycerate dehydrogenase-like enzyme
VSSFAPGVPDSLIDEFEVQRLGSLEELFAQNDIVVELEALTEERREMVKEEHFRMLPDGGVFVNIGRGPLVDQRAIEKVAQEGRIQFALDVYESEPLPEDSPLRGLPNVLLLPHVAGPTMDRRRDAGEQALENARRYFMGEPLLSPVTLEVYERST